MMNCSWINIELIIYILLNFYIEPSRLSFRWWITVLFLLCKTKNRLADEHKTELEFLDLGKILLAYLGNIWKVENTTWVYLELSRRTFRPEGKFDWIYQTKYRGLEKCIFNIISSHQLWSDQTNYVSLWM